MMELSSPPSILIAEDEEPLADLYAAWLEPDYAVTTVHDGDKAIELLDGSVDVMLLDRQMPGQSGDAVLEAMGDMNCVCKVAMITAVDPDFDIVHLDCDEYLTKPVSRDDLSDTVERLVRLSTYDEQLQSYYRLVTKKATLETEKSADELANSPEYLDLVARINELREELDTTIADFDENDFTNLFEDLPISTPSSPVIDD